MCLVFCQKASRLRWHSRQKDVENDVQATSKLFKSSHLNILQVLQSGLLFTDSILFIDGRQKERRIVDLQDIGKN